MDLLIISPIHTSHAIYYSQYLFLLNMWQIAINVNLILKILLFLENECLIFYKIVHFYVIHWIVLIIQISWFMYVYFVPLLHVLNVIKLNKLFC